MQFSYIVQNIYNTVLQKCQQNANFVMKLLSSQTKTVELKWMHKTEHKKEMREHQEKRNRLDFKIITKVHKIYSIIVITSVNLTTLFPAVKTQH